MVLPAVGAGRLCSVVSAGAGSRGVLFRAKAASFGVPALCGSMAVFVAFETLVDSGAADGSSNSSRFILPEELVGVNNHIGVHGGGKFHH